MTLTSAATEAPRRTAAVHRRVAAAQHDHALADGLDVAERYRGQPVDADVDVQRGFGAARDLQVAPARRAAADEDRVVALRHQALHRLDAFVVPEMDAQVEDVAGLLVDHRLGQPEARDLGADEAAGLGLAVEHGDVIAERREVARHRERGRPGADAGDALAVLLPGLGHASGHVVLQVGGDALEAADRDWFGMLAIVFLDAAAPAGGLAGPVAGAAENAGEDVGDPVDHVGVAVTTLRDQPDVFRNRCVCGASPLAIDDLVEIGGVGDVGSVQNSLLAVSPAPPGTGACGAADSLRDPCNKQRPDLQTPSVSMGRRLMFLPAELPWPRIRPKTARSAVDTCQLGQEPPALGMAARKPAQRHTK